MNLSKRIRSKLNREGKYLFRELNHKLGFYNSFYKAARGSRIMIYHGICIDDHTRFNPIFLKLKMFEEHIKFYKKHFNVISLDDYYEQKFSNDKFRDKLKRLANRFGIKEIHFHASPDTDLHNSFAVRFKSIPSFPVIFKQTGESAGTDKIKFTSADIDTF